MNIKNYFILFSFLVGLSAFSNNDKYRIVINDDPATKITIAWNQISGSNPIVYYGTTDLGTNWQSYPNQKGVDRQLSFKGMDNRFARLTGLTPNTSYYFVIHDSQGTSSRFWFKTAPDDTSRLSFIAGGDSRNNRTPRQRANRLVSKLKPHAVLFGGDMTNGNSSAEWQEWFDDWQFTTASDGRMFPIVAARGNHETDTSTIYNLFDTPNQDSYYAVTFGDNLIRCYTLNSEISVLGNQKTWLESDLTNSGTSLWKMAQYHKPMRPHTSGKSEGNDIYNAWAQLFYDEGVNLVVDCDSHTVKTTYPVRPSNGPNSDEGFEIDNLNGTVYTGEGCWGAPLRSNNDDKTWTRNSGSFNQFKLIFVGLDKIELRTIKVDNADSVGENTNADPFQLPANLDVFTPSIGEDVVNIFPNGGGNPCPDAGTACDDGDANTLNDVEDGNCNCYGIPQNGTLNITVTEDAEEGESGAMYLDSSDLELVFDTHNSQNNQTVGLRFNNIPLPSNATINNAYIQFTVDEATTGATSLAINGDFSGDASSFNTNSGNISNRPSTSSQNEVTWNNVPSWNSVGESGPNQRTPDLSSLVQEILGHPNWVENNAMAFVITGTGKRTAESMDGSPSGAARLVINYSLNTGPTCNAPGNLNVSSISTTEADLSWNANSTATEGYEWLVMPTGVNPDPANAIDNGVTISGNTVVQVSGLSASTTYDVYVRSDCGLDVGISNWSTAVSFTTSDLPTCDAPTNLSISAITSTGVDLSWNENTSETDGYEWVAMPTGVSPDTSNAAANGTTASGTTSAQVGGLNPTTYYDVYVRSNCGSVIGISDWSNTISFSTLNPDGSSICSAPSNLAANSTTFNSTVVSWNIVSSASDGYTWVVMPDGDSPSTAGAVVSGSENSSATSVNVTGLSQLTNYDIYVRSNCGTNGVGSWSNSLSIITLLDTSNCAEEGTVCNDGDSSTNYDEEDGSCICNGVPNTAFEQDFPILNSDDDANEKISNGDVKTDDGKLKLGQDGNNDMLVGLRFNNINLPEGAVIERAYIQFEAENDEDGNASLVIKGERKANSQTFNESDDNISNRTTTSNEVEWNNVADWQKNDSGSDQKTPNVASLINEIMNTTSWSSGNPLTFIISGNGERVSKSFDDDVPPILTIVYTIYVEPTCDVPENLSVNNITTSDVNLNWSADSTASDGYEWVLMPSGMIPDPFNAVANGTTISGITSAQVNGLNDTTSYDVYVRSDCGQELGFSEWSSVVSFATLEPYVPPTCDTPTSLAANNVTFSQVDLNWNPDSSASEGYDWVVMPSGVIPDPFNAIANGTTSIGTTSVQVSGLSPLTSYDAYVRSDCGLEVGLSDWSIVELFTTLELPTCDSPTGLNTSNLTYSEVDLSWSAESSASVGYEWVVMLAGLSPDPSSAVTNGATISGVTTIQVSNLSPSTSYDVFVRSDCGLEVGLSDWSAAASFTTLDLPPCNTPTNLNTSNITTTEVDLNWNADASASEGYEWVVMPAGVSPEPSNAVANGVTISGITTAQVNGLSASTSYDVYVRSDCGLVIGLSDWSSAVSFITLDIPACSAPTDLNTSNLSFSSVDLNWTVVANATNGYDWLVMPNGLSPNLTNAVASGNTNSSTSSVNVSGLTPQTSYDIYVRSDCGTNNTSSWSNSLSITTLFDTSNCPEAGTPCNDGNSNTNYDEEDGLCNCIGIPNTATILDIPIQNKSDDAREKIQDGDVKIDESKFKLGQDGDKDLLIGLRFKNINLPPGSVIKRAYIQFESDSDKDESTSLVIKGERNANALTFIKSDYNISSRVTTSNEVEWNNLPEWFKDDNGLDQRSPNLVSLINEIMNTTSWSSGNPLTFIISGYGKREAKSFDDDVPPILRLIIEGPSSRPGQNQESQILFGNIPNKVIEELKLYPNPANSVLNIEMDAPNSDTGNIRIIDMLGREQQTIVQNLNKGKNRFTINLDNLNSGYYFVEIRFGNQKIIKKIAKR